MNKRNDRKAGNKRLIWLCAVVVVLLVLWTAISLSMAQSDARKQIASAATAPLVAFEHRDAARLCSAFAPEVAAHLMSGTATGGCKHRVSAVLETSPKPEAVGKTEVSRVSWHGDRGRATLVKREEGQVFEDDLSLRRVGHKWLVATRAKLIAVSCHSHHISCGKHSHVLILVMGLFVARPSPVVPPVAVKRVEGRKLPELEAGERVAVQSGCLACHRIGQRGNAGPGRALTHVGARLNAAQIRRALLSPSLPMPAFAHLQKEKLRALVRFLAQLR